MSEILSSVLAATTSMLVALTIRLLTSRLRRALGREKPPEKSYSQRLTELTSSLTRASREVDEVLAELAQVAREREGTVRQLESDLGSLESKEQELKERIELLERTPLAVAEHFAALLDPREKRSARRDYLLFGSGVLVTTVIAIILQLFAG
jgi:septal ring factor EnvC (AmiA/AmiB activator)